MIKILPSLSTYHPFANSLPCWFMWQNLSSGINDGSDIRVRGDHRWNRPAHTQLPAFLATYQGLTCQKALSKGSDGFGIR